MKERRNAEAILTRDLKNIPSLKPAQKRKEAKGSVSGPTKRQQKDDVSKVIHYVLLYFWKFDGVHAAEFVRTVAAHLAICNML